MNLRKTVFEAIGTKWTIDCFDEISDTAWEQLQADTQARIADFDRSYSRFREDSWVCSIAKQAGEYGLPEGAYLMLSFYEKLYRVTAGKVTPLIGRLMEDTGYDASYSLTPKAVLTHPPEWKDSLGFTRDSLMLKQPLLLDFGAAGKGYLVDIVAGIMESSGLKSFTINAGGDILHHSKPPITVGLENPLDTSEVIGTVILQNQSLCASSTARRRWGNYHHIMDPHSKRPVRNILATWVIANDTMTADGLSTALFFTDPELLTKQFSFEYGLLVPNMGFRHSKDFPAQLFTEQNR